jgi:Reverse transcriptase (RNA-dependent DNA polymerase)
MDIPSQFEYQGSRKDHCLLLKKTLYGQKQAGRVWNQYLHDGLLARGFRQSVVDTCLYYRKDVALHIYTNDRIRIGPSPVDLDAIIELLKAPIIADGAQTHRAFNITDEGTLDEYLGVKVEQLPNGTIKLLQPQLIQQILDNLGFNGRTTTKDSPAAPTVRLHRGVHRKPYTNNWHYQSIIGKLNFLEKSTRPDIACAVHQCARFCLEPKGSHTTAVKRIKKYLMDNRDKGMKLSPKAHSFECYVNADFVGNWNWVTADVDAGTAKSRTAYTISYAGCPVAWASNCKWKWHSALPRPSTTPCQKLATCPVPNASGQRGQRSWMRDICWCTDCALQGIRRQLRSTGNEPIAQYVTTHQALVRTTPSLSRARAVGQDIHTARRLGETIGRHSYEVTAN